jgi:hypothetical protein
MENSNKIMIKTTQVVNPALNKKTFRLTKIASQLAIVVGLLLIGVVNVFSQTIQEFTTTGAGTWTCPSNVFKVTVECWGGGGGGASGTTNGYYGGGGGGAFSRSIINVTPGTVYNFNIGAGGAAGSAGGVTWFNASTTSPYSSTASAPTATTGGILARGGNGVANNTAAGASGGSSATGFWIAAGYSGGNGGTGAGATGTGGGGGGAGSLGNGGNGGSVAGGKAGAGFGGGDGANGRTSGGIGYAGFENYGSGGSGSRRTTAAGNTTGGAGAQGFLKLTYVSVTATASPATICSGGSSTLTGNTSSGPVILYAENFERYNISNIQPLFSGTEYFGWKTVGTNNYTRWTITGVSPIAGLKSLSMYDNYWGYQNSYYGDGDYLGYTNNLLVFDNSQKIYATNYTNLLMNFSWQCVGESGYDYGMICYSTDGTNWTNLTTGGPSGDGRYLGQSATQTVTNLALPAALNGQQFWIGFRWINDNSVSNDPPFRIDDITITGTPNVSYAWTGGSPAGGTTPTAQTTSVSPTANTTYNYTLTVGGVTGTTSALVTVNVCPVPTISSFTPSSVCASAGSTVSITGTNFTGATAVSIGGTAAVSYVVNSSTQITATIGSGTTGQITVSNPVGSATSATNLTVSATPSVSTASPATSIAATSATANWTSSLGASQYFLDVSTSNTFSSFVGAYNNLNVGNVTAYSITGLSPLTTYYYRVRASNGTCTSFSGSSVSFATPCAPTGDPSAYGNGSWLGYVYNSASAGGFDSYQGYVTEAEIFNRTHTTIAAGASSFHCSSNTDFFAVRYRMTKNFNAGYYTFTVGGDDGVRLSLDGGATWHINGWVDQGYTTYSSSTPVYLSGNVNLVFEYYENSGGSQSSFSYLLSAFPYCETVYTTGKTDGDLISNISISGTTLSNNSGTAQVNPAYTFFTGQPNYTASLVASNSYNVTVTVGTWGAQGIAAWIDYNDNNVFEASEKIGNTATTIGSGTGGTPIPANHTATFVINLSCSPPLGSHRMRVRDVYNVAGPSIDPCATYTFGETEDYLITIVAGTPFTPAFTSTPSTPSCVNSQVTYTATAGQTNYSWTFPGVAGVDYTLVSGGTSTSNTATIVYLTSGSKTISMNYSSPLGCSSSGPITNTIVLDPTSVAGTVNANQTICSGSSPANITLTGNTGTIQWQVSTDNVTFTNISGATSSPLASAQMGPLTATRYYRAVVTSGVCSSVNSAVVTVTVNPTSVAGTVSANQTICYNTSPTNITLTGNTGTIQWQSSTTSASTGFSNIAGATTSTLTSVQMGVLTATTYYRAIVTSGVCSSVNSASLTVTVNALPSISASASPTSVCPGAATTLSASGGNSYTWNNGAGSGTGLSVNLSATTTYTVTGTDANGCTNTASTTVTVNNTADWANLQWPQTAAIDCGSNASVYGKIYEASLTPTAGADGTITVEVGVSNSNTDPSTWAAGSWSPASYNAQVSNDDEYTASIGNSLAPGTYYYTFRYQIGSNGCYKYGGYNGGFWNGTTNVNGTLTVNGSILDYANVQFPTSGSICSGATYTVYGQVYEAGVTNGAGAASGLMAEIGVSTSNTDPSTWAAGAWSSAAFNAQSGNNDEFVANIGSTLPLGTYYYAFRYKLSSSCNYQYGATNGFWNGTSNVNGVLTVGTLSTTTAATGDYIWKGATNTDWSTASNWMTYNGSTYSVATVPPTASNKVIIPAPSAGCVVTQPATITNLSGSASDIVIESGASLGLASATLSVYGNWTNNGTFTPGTGSVAFVGASGNQSITKAGGETFSNLVVNKASGNVILNNEVTVSGSLTLTNGLLELGTSNLVMGGATLTGGSTASYVKTASSGVLKRNVGATATAFPIGNGSYNPAILTNSGTSDLFSVSITDGATTSPNSSLNRAWLIEEATGGGSNITMRLFWNGVGDESAAFTSATGQIFVDHFTSGSWVNEGGTSNTTSSPNYIETSNISSFSPFTVSRFATPLPVELMTLDAQCAGDNVLVSWKTASEHNSLNFIVERSENGSNWTEIQTVTAAGNSNTIMEYAIEDAGAARGVNYYRLIQTDQDGVQKVYGPVLSNCGSDNNQFMSFPNPSDADITLVFNDKNIVGSTTLMVRDAHSRVVRSIALEIQPGTTSILIPDMELTPGVYYLQLEGDNFKSPVIKHSLR